jgi:hypothetical protein
MSIKRDKIDLGIMARLLLKNIRSKKRAANIVNTDTIVRKELDMAMDIIRKDLERLLNAIVDDWKSNITFKSRKEIKAKLIAINVFPTGPDKKIWSYVDKGTPPHKIVAKNAPNLVFKTGYQPKTLAKPARTVSSGGKATGDIIAKKVVNHPGIKAREFEKTIAGDYKTEFRKKTELAMRKSANEINKF